MMLQELEEKLKNLSGKIGFYYHNLVTGERMEYGSQEKMTAASVIKLYIMATAFQRIHEGSLKETQMIVMRKEDYVPSCGAVAYMHEGLQVTVMDLITLMIIFSDNTATNVLIDLLGMEEINKGIRKLGFKEALLRRKMYDVEMARQGIQNLITARETGALFVRLYEGTLVSSEASKRMVDILKNQQLNGKIPFYLQALSEEPEIAHKTGEDTGITHDVGIIYGREPFVVCFCGNETDTPAFDRAMAEISLDLYRRGQEKS